MLDIDHFVHILEADQMALCRGTVVEEGALALLGRWESFYVIVGSAAAALTGLQFVVIALGADQHRGTVETNRVFGTPTIVHFCKVLFIAAILSAPWPNVVDAAYALGGCGIAGLLYAGMLVWIVPHQTAYKPVLEDWICHFTLPPLAYAIVLGAATLFQRNLAGALFVVAGATLLLLFVGIHNAWDSASFIALNQRKDMQ